MIEFGVFKEKKEIMMPSGLIKSVILQFNNCYQGFNNKENCNKEFKNVRFHNVDIRSYFDEKYLGSFYDYVFYTLTIYKTDYFKRLYDILDDGTEDNVNYVFNKLKNIPSNILQDGNKNITVGRHIINRIYADYKFKKYKNVKNIEYINDYIEYQANKFVGIHNVFNMIEKMNNKTLSKYEVQSLMVKFERLLRDIGTLCMDYYSLVRFMKILSYGCKNVLYLAGNFHIENFKNFIRSFDTRVILVKGSYEINDDLYNLYITCINNLKIKRLLGYTKYVMRLEPIIRILYNIIDYLIKKDADKRLPIWNLMKILENILNIDNEKTLYIINNPNKRIVKINSSEIESKLLA